MAKGIGTLTVWLNLDKSKFQKGMVSARGSIKQFSSNVVSISAIAASALGAIGIAALNIGSKLEETRNKFDVTFSGIAASAQKASNELVNSYGMAEESSKKLLSGTGDLLTGFGFTQDQSLNLSLQVQKLAVDLASFQNIEGGAARASQALEKALVGEAEQAKALGIVIRQDSQEYKKMVASLMETQGMTLLQAKAQTALNIAVSQSKNAIGDFARTSDQYANSSRVLGERLKDLWSQLGFIALKSTEAGSNVTSLSSIIKDLTDSIKRNANGIIFTIQSVFIDAQTGFFKLQRVFEGVFTDLLTGFNWVNDNVGKLFSNFLDIGKAVLSDYLSVVQEFWKSVFSVAKTSISEIWNIMTGGSVSEAFSNIFKKAAEGFDATIMKIGSKVGVALENAGIGKLELGGFSEIAADFDMLNKEAEKKKSALFENAIAEVGRIANVSKKLPEDIAKSTKTDTRSGIVGAIQRGTVEALRAESKGKTKESEIATNTKRTADGIDKLSSALKLMVNTATGSTISTQDAFAG